jgi:hypothetical protein
MSRRVKLNEDVQNSPIDQNVLAVLPTRSSAVRATMMPASGLLELPQVLGPAVCNAMSAVTRTPSPAALSAITPL